MRVATNLRLDFLHALIRQLDNAHSIPLLERIHAGGGLKAVLNNELCLRAEEDFFPYVDATLLEKMFELCEQYIYSEEVINALNHEAQYIAIGA
jgi:hypothetical protein